MEGRATRPPRLVGQGNGAPSGLLTAVAFIRSAPAARTEVRHMAPGRWRLASFPTSPTRAAGTACAAGRGCAAGAVYNSRLIVAENGVTLGAGVPSPWERCYGVEPVPAVM